MATTAGKIRRNFSFTLVVVLFGGIMLTACAGTDGDIVSGTGTVKFVDLEGGFYGIVGDGGEKYDPSYLSHGFQQDGLRVRFKAKRQENIASIHMWGAVVELVSIERLK